MAGRPARIESPEVIKELRNRFAELDQVCRNALMGCSADFEGTKEWLRAEQRMYWKRQLRKREEDWVTAKREYALAKDGAGSGSRASGVEELRALEKAKRRKEEAEMKLRTVDRWAVFLEQNVFKMMGPCNVLMILLDRRTPQAMARLDMMLDNLEEYFRPGPGGTP